MLYVDLSSVACNFILKSSMDSAASSAQGLARDRAEELRRQHPARHLPHGGALPAMAQGGGPSEQQVPEPIPSMIYSGEEHWQVHGNLVDIFFVNFIYVAKIGAKLLKDHGNLNRCKGKNVKPEKR